MVLKEQTMCQKLLFWSVMVLILALTAFSSAPVLASHKDNMSEALRAYDSGNYDRAHKIWSHHAKGGNPGAMTALASMYQNGEGRPTDSATSWKWYQRAADRGDVMAQLNLGDMLAAPPRTHGNIERAYFWLGLASAGGNKFAGRLQKKISDFLSREERALLDKEISEWSPLSDKTPVND